MPEVLGMTPPRLVIPGEINWYAMANGARHVKSRYYMDDGSYRLVCNCGWSVQLPSWNKCQRAYDGHLNTLNGAVRPLDPQPKETP